VAALLVLEVPFAIPGLLWNLGIEIGLLSIPEFPSTGNAIDIGFR
jgi:hypothetical protein